MALRELAGVSFRSLWARPAILVVDGHSTDGTAEVAARWGVELIQQTGRGKGAAVREGLAWAAEHGYPSVAVMDADATYPAASLPALFNLLESGRELVVGIRRPEPPKRWTARDAVHRAGNKILNYAAAQLTGSPLMDICSGFWGLRTSILGELALESDGFDIEAELFVKAFRLGLKVAQIPIRYRTRAGEAKLHAVRDGAHILLSIARYGRTSPSLVADAAPASALSSLYGLIIGLSPQRILLLAAPPRFEEARQLAHHLAMAAPEAEVTTATLAPRTDPRPLPALLKDLTRPTPGLPGAVVVALPSRGEGGADRGRILVGIPRTRRCLQFFSEMPDGARTPAAASLVASAGFRRERPPRGRSAAWLILASSLDPSWSRNELALLGANDLTGGVSIYRQPPASPVESLRRTILPDLLHAPLALTRVWTRSER